MARVKAIGDEYVLLVLTRTEARGLRVVAGETMETPEVAAAALPAGVERAAATRAYEALRRGLALLGSPS